jgi:hypothetical protein
MPEHLVGFQVASTPQQGPQQQQQQVQMQEQIQPRRPRATASSSLSEFIVDDFKLFVSPVTVVVNEFLKQLKR